MEIREQLKKELVEYRPTILESQKQLFYKYQSGFLDTVVRLLYDVLRLCGVADNWIFKNLDMLVSSNGKTKLSEALLRLKGWDFKNPNLIYISGGAGVGKTHIAVSLLKQYVIDFISRNILDIIYADAQGNLSYDWDKVEKFKSTFIKERWAYDIIRAQDFDKSRFVKSICEKPILVIDDLFADRDTEFARSTMLAIIDERVDWIGKPTIITSNYNLQYISENIDDRIASRLSVGISIEITSLPDYRKKSN